MMMAARMMLTARLVSFMLDGLRQDLQASCARAGSVAFETGVPLDGLLHGWLGRFRFT
jgi:hypothetical protein